MLSNLAHAVQTLGWCPVHQADCWSLRHECRDWLLQVCPTPQRYKYAYAVVWEGTFTGCHWATGDCIAPLQGQDCVTLRCDNSEVVCPPNCGSYLLLCLHSLSWLACLWCSGMLCSIESEK